jgi:transposase
LAEEERQQLALFTRKGVASARELRRARMLLLAASGHRDTEIAAAVGCCAETVARTRRRGAQEGVEAARHDRTRPGAAPLLDARAEATLIALACTDGPDGRDTWTMHLLADRLVALVALGVVEQLSDETVRRTLKKTPSSLGSARRGAWAR